MSNSRATALVCLVALFKVDSARRAKRSEQIHSNLLSRAKPRPTDAAGNVNLIIRALHRRRVVAFSAPAARRARVSKRNFKIRSSSRASERGARGLATLTLRSLSGLGPAGSIEPGPLRVDSHWSQGRAATGLTYLPTFLRTKCCYHTARASSLFHIKASRRRRTPAVYRYDRSDGRTRFQSALVHTSILPLSLFLFVVAAISGARGQALALPRASSRSYKRYYVKLIEIRRAPFLFLVS